MPTLEAVVLAGGFGTRLSSVVTDRPKVLAEVGGRPFLAYLLDQLEREGCRRVVLAVGHLADMVEHTIGPRHGLLEVAYSRESQPLGTGGGVALAARHVGSDPVLVLNGDSYCHLDLPGMAASHRAHGGLGTLAVVRVGDASRYGTVRLADDDRIVAFEEKTAEAVPGWVNAGVYLLSATRLRSLQTGRPSSLERDAFPAWVGGGLHGFASPGPFLDIGTPESYAMAERFLATLGG